MDHAKKFSTSHLHTESNHEIYEHWRAHDQAALGRKLRSEYDCDASISRRVYNQAFYTTLLRTTFELWKASFSGFPEELGQDAKQVYLALITHNGDYDDRDRTGDPHGASSNRLKGKNDISAKWALHHIKTHLVNRLGQPKSPRKQGTIEGLNNSDEEDELAKEASSVRQVTSMVDVLGRIAGERSSPALFQRRIEGGGGRGKPARQKVSSGGMGLKTVSVLSATDPSTGKSYFYNTHTQKVGWNAEEVSRTATNLEYGGVSNAAEEIMVLSNPLFTRQVKLAPTASKSAVL
jgi:hypothetical protein